MFKTILAKICKDTENYDSNTAAIAAAMKQNQALLKELLNK